MDVALECDIHADKTQHTPACVRKRKEEGEEPTVKKRQRKGSLQASYAAPGLRGRDGGNGSSSDSSVISGRNLFDRLPDTLLQKIYGWVYCHIQQVIYTGSCGGAFLFDCGGEGYIGLSPMYIVNF